MVDGKEAFLYAITNVGSSDCTGTIPRLYTRVTEHLKWIYEVTEGEAGDPRSSSKCEENKEVKPKAGPWKKATRTLGRTVNAPWFPNKLKATTTKETITQQTTTTTAKPTTTTQKQTIKNNKKNKNRCKG